VLFSSAPFTFYQDVARYFTPYIWGVSRQFPESPKII
jgi:hypothetical protein